MKHLRLLTLVTALWTVGTCLAIPSDALLTAPGSTAPRVADWPPLGCPTCATD